MYAYIHIHGDFLSLMVSCHSGCMQIIKWTLASMRPLSDPGAFFKRKIADLRSQIKIIGFESGAYHENMLFMWILF